MIRLNRVDRVDRMDRVSVQVRGGVVHTVHTVHTVLTFTHEKENNGIVVIQTHMKYAYVERTMCFCMDRMDRRLQKGHLTCGNRVVHTDFPYGPGKPTRKGPKKCSFN